jgi:archaetidylinositol phosphate synthase
VSRSFSIRCAKTIRQLYYRNALFLKRRNATGDAPVLSRLKSYADRLLSRPANFLVNHGFTPNVLTLIGLAIGLVAGIVLALGYFVAGGVLILLTGFVDTLDGAVARNGGATTTFGATLDSISDRYVDCIVLLGLGIAGVNWLYVGVALMGSLLVSYVRAKAEGIGISCTAGIAERSERLIILAIGLIVGLVEPAVLLVAILAQFTALWRVRLLLRRTSR